MKTFKWTVEIEVAESQVADGIDLTDERMHSALTRAFPYAEFNEFACTVVKAPSPESIAIAQGAYKRLGWFRKAGTAGKWHLLIEVAGVNKWLCQHAKSAGPLEAHGGDEGDPKHFACTECKRRDES